MTYLSCIVRSIESSLQCDGPCGRYCNGWCNRYKDDVIMREWYIYSDASIWDISDGNFDLAFDLINPYHQRIC